jgi:hypothetical protein
MGKKKTIAVFCLILILQCFFILLWGTQKVRLNVDEMFTMEGVKQGGRGKWYWDIAEDFYGNEYTYQKFLDHMTVTAEDLLLYQGMSEVYDALMHRTFYYSLLNLVSTMNPNHIPWTVGVGLNLLLFIFSQVILYLIARRTLGEAGALGTMVIYGFSAGAISTVLYVRCYMLLTMYVLLLFFLYSKFMDTERGWKKLLYIVSLGFLAFLCYRTHQFGTILFGIITALFILYMIKSRNKNALIWLAAGYGIPFLLGFKIIFPKLQNFFAGGIATLFYSIVHNMDAKQLTLYLVKVLCNMAQHLFVRVGILLLLVAVMILLYGRILYVHRKNAGQCKDAINIKWPLPVISVITVAAYYGILAMGSAVAWKYLSPVYPLIVLVFVSIMVWISRTMGLPFRTKAVIVAAGMALMLASYDTQHISELFAEEAGMRDILEDKYHGLNGILIHHDVQGDGEVYLYEAAALWPEESNVLVLQHHMIMEKGLFECRDDDRILLWLTADFDRDESISLFKECTDYRNFELVLNTDHVWVYECWK